ncbi:MAG: acetoin utilization protein AcuC [Candidatus Eisenbacteria bacterium]|nr:acetoin utilization protein AcuC [Candidatus Eisenbacteria bacterium]
MEEHHRTALIHSDRFAQYDLGEDHPFKPVRSQLVYDLAQRHGYLGKPWMRIEEPCALDDETISHFHDWSYIHALQEANRGEFRPDMIRYNLGTLECPVVPGLYDYAVLVAGAGYRAMELTFDDGVRTAFSPLGGMHHAARNYASGFCYINDCGLIIDELLRRGKRVAYIDIDAHHGDGVQKAFYAERRVLKISLHESGETLFPWGGNERETGSGRGKGFNVNVPLPEEIDDALYILTFDKIVPPLIHAFEPDVIVAVIGIDTVASDPLTHLCLTNNGFCEVVTRMRDFRRPLIALGGGGYNLDSLARGWTLAWAIFNGIEPPEDDLGAIGGVLLGQQDLSGGSLRDMHQYLSGPKREAVEAKLKPVVDYIRREVFPFHGL